MHTACEVGAKHCGASYLACEVAPALLHIATLRTRGHRINPVIGYTMVAMLDAANISRRMLNHLSPQMLPSRNVSSGAPDGL